MKRLLIISVVLTVLAAPAFAWDVTTTDGFEDGTLANWTISSGSMAAVNAPKPVRTGYWAAEQGSASVAAQNRMGRDFRVGGFEYYQGQLEAYVYDDCDFAQNTDLRVAAMSTYSFTSASGVVGAVTTTSYGWGSTDYYSGMFSWTGFKMDGVYVPGAIAGITWGTPVAAPRSVGWHRFRVTWAYDYAIGFGEVKFYVDSTLAPKFSYAIDSTAGRWANGHNVAGATIGTFSSGVYKNQYVDDVVFRGDSVPEPASLLALGSGLVGLVGFIRRRK